MKYVLNCDNPPKKCCFNTLKKFPLSRPLRREGPNRDLDNISQGNLNNDHANNCSLTFLYWKVAKKDCTADTQKSSSTGKQKCSSNALVQEVLLLNSIFQPFVLVNIRPATPFHGQFQIRTTCVSVRSDILELVRPDEMWLCSLQQGLVNSFVFKFSCFATLPTDSHCHRPRYLTKPMCISTWCVQKKNVRWTETVLNTSEREGET